MPAPFNNQYYKLRSKDGREKLFESPEELWNEAMKYFEWCNNNPWKRNEAVKAGDHFGEQVKADTQRPFTIQGLCVYLGIDRQTFKNYGNKAGYEDYFEVFNIIIDIIESQQIEGSMVGAFNANITARLLGLQERMDLTSKGKEINKLNLSQYTAEELHQLALDAKELEKKNN